ncbi:unnamed protein product [marine sediment metagenome]|uniref:Uncharacterized protein n=1 Tax=marine sediment metagenome TaxID=412755 RepID=X1P019_9ZZZZ
MGVKCKDCSILQLLEFKIENVTTMNHACNIINKEPWRMLRVTYCPTCDLVVDISTERECGCFNKVIR